MRCKQMQLRPTKLHGDAQTWSLQWPSEEAQWVVCKVTHRQGSAQCDVLNVIVVFLFPFPFCCGLFFSSSSRIVPCGEPDGRPRVKRLPRRRRYLVIVAVHKAKAGQPLLAQRTSSLAPAARAIVPRKWPPLFSPALASYGTDCIPPQGDERSDSLPTLQCIRLPP